MSACTFGWDDLDPRLVTGESAGGDGRGGESAGGFGGSGSASGGSASGGSASGGSASGGSASGGSPSGGGGAGGIGGTGGGSTVSSFADDFDRENDATVGNDWIEKTPDAFGIEGFALIRTAAGPGYRDNLLIRPFAETLLDVEVAVELELKSNSVGRPQIFVRGQTDSILTPNAYDAYVLWLNGTTTEVVLSRQSGTASSTTLSTITVTEPFAPDHRYRLRLRVSGTDPVDLYGYVDVKVSSGWDSLGSTRYHDASDDRIDSSGVTGIGAATDTDYLLENFSFTSD